MDLSGAGPFIVWLDITASKFDDWRERYGKVNEHNGWVPRDFWLEDWEKQAIIGFHLKNPLEGYRRLTFMMLDADIVAVSPSGVWRVHGLRAAAGSTSALAHRCFLSQHWRDILLPVQRPGRLQPVHRELGHPGVNDRANIEIILQGAKEKYQEARPRIISALSLIHI